MKQKIIFILFIGCQLVNGQQQPIDPTVFNYAKADSIALNFPKGEYKSYADLASWLTADLHTDHEKFRVLFRWITDNISYSKSNKSGDANKVLRSKKAVCAGYAALLEAMCNYAGIYCETVIGYSKTDINDINKPLKTIDHAWNAVELNGKWYLVDVTWATSYYDRKTKKTVKSFNELYYLTSPEAFAAKHFPKDEKWQLLDKPVSKSDFIKSPIYYDGFFNHHLTELQPNKGVIKVRLKDSIEIKFKTENEIKSAVIELGNEKFIYRPEVVIKDNTYFIRQKFEEAGIFELTLFLNKRGVVVYRLEARE